MCFYLVKGDRRLHIFGGVERGKRRVSGGWGGGRSWREYLRRAQIMLGGAQRMADMCQPLGAQHKISPTECEIAPCVFFRLHGALFVTCHGARAARIRLLCVRPLATADASGSAGHLLAARALRASSPLHRSPITAANGTPT